MVIAPKPLTEFVPLYRSQKDEGEITTQWAMKEIERVGLLKMDFLGLRTLTIIRDTISLVKKNYGIDINIDEIPLDDRKTYDLISKGETHGVFQLESAGSHIIAREKE